MPKLETGAEVPSDKERFDAKWPRVPPRFAAWIKLVEWNLREGIPLLFNLDPRDGAGLCFRTALAQHFNRVPSSAKRDQAWIQTLASLDVLGGRELLIEMHDAYNNACAAHSRDLLDISQDHSVIPLDLVAWADKQGYSIPKELSLHYMKPTQDRSQESQRIAELETEAAVLKDEVVALRSDLDGTWRGFNEEAENYPRELDIAMQAWRAVSNQKPGTTTVSKRLDQWIRESYPSLGEEAIKRLVVVANWDKSPGRKKSPK